MIGSLLLAAIGLAGSALAAAPDITAEATSAEGAVVDFPANLINCTPTSGSMFPLGSTFVTCTDTEIPSQVSFYVIVQDTTGPAIGGVPGALVFEATSRAGVELTYSLPVAVDLVDGSRPVSCSPASGTFFPIGQTTVSCSSTDSLGNSSSASFMITVRDTTPPVFRDKPPGAVKRVKGKQRAKVVYAAPVATDTVDGDIKSVCTPRSGSVFKFGTTTVFCTATDSHGNKSQVSLQVRVAKIGPDLLAPPDGIQLSSPPLLRWTAVKNATYYNIQLYRQGHKVLSQWPRSNQLQVERSWTYEGKKYFLTAGTYTWYVWPGFRDMAAGKYGALIGQRSFTIRPAAEHPLKGRPRSERRSPTAIPPGYPPPEAAREAGRLPA